MLFCGCFLLFILDPIVESHKEIVHLNSHPLRLQIEMSTDEPSPVLWMGKEF